MADNNNSTDLGKVGNFTKSAVSSGQVLSSGTKIDNGIKEFKKTGAFENKVSSAKNVTIDFSVFLDEMNYDKSIEVLDNVSEDTHIDASVEDRTRQL